MGRLVRWLRIIGQDVSYGSHLSGHGLIRTARKEGRLILTRDRGILKKSPPETLIIRSDHFREQLKQVIQSCGLDPLGKAFTRCVECNQVLKTVDKTSVQDRVPPYVYATQDNFSLCQHCKRIYWPATHHDKMIEELRSLDPGSRGN